MHKQCQIGKYCRLCVLMGVFKESDSMRVEVLAILRRANETCDVELTSFHCGFTMWPNSVSFKFDNPRDKSSLVIRVKSERQIENVSKSLPKRVWTAPLEPHGSEIRDRGVFFYALPETRRSIPSARPMLRHPVSSLRLSARLHRDNSGSRFSAEFPRSSSKASPSDQRPRVRVKCWLALLGQFPVFEEGLEIPILPGYVAAAMSVVWLQFQRSCSAPRMV